MPQNQERGSSNAPHMTAPPQPLPRKGRTPDEGDVICCGTPMEPQLAHARDRSGHCRVVLRALRKDRLLRAAET